MAEVDVQNLLVFKNNCKWIFVDILDVTLKENQRCEPLSPWTHESEQMTNLLENQAKWYCDFKKKRASGLFGSWGVTWLSRLPGCESWAGYRGGRGWLFLTRQTSREISPSRRCARRMKMHKRAELGMWRYTKRCTQAATLTHVDRRHWFPRQPLGAN